MVTEPQTAPRHAGQVVRRVLLRRNIAVDAESARLVAAVQTSAPPGHYADIGAFPPPTASRCSDLAPAIRQRESRRGRPAVDQALT